MDPQLHLYTGADDLIFGVYRDTAHHNTGEHMPRGIDPVRDAFWRRQYKKIVMSRLRLVDLPAGKVTERFILRLVQEFKGLRESLWNSERVLVFLAVILRQEPDVRKYCNIQKFIAKRLDEWEAGRYTTLVCNVEERVWPSTVKRERSNNSGGKKV